MRTKEFWMDTAERAAKTLAQNLAATMSVALASTAIWDIDWRYSVGVALTATVYSVLTSVGSAGLRNPESPSLVAPKTPVPPHHPDTFPRG